MNLSILNTEIRIQESLYCLNDLHKSAGNEAKHKPDNFLRQDHIKELIAEIDNFSDVRSLKILTGRRGGTFACKELVYSYAMWISAKFHLHVIRAFDAIQMQNAKPAPQLPAALTPGQKCHIKAIIADKCRADSKAYQTLYTNLNKNFGVTKYDEILAVNYPAACQFLGAKPLEGEIVNDSQVAPVAEMKPIDVAEKMLSGLEPCRIKLPDDITHEIDRQSFSMALEAYELSREHIARQIAYKCVMGSQGLNKDFAMQVIKQQTLGKALTHKFHSELDQTWKMAKSVAMLAEQYCENVTKALMH